MSNEKLLTISEKLNENDVDVNFKMWKYSFPESRIASKAWNEVFVNVLMKFMFYFHSVQINQLLIISRRLIVDNLYSL